MVYFKSQFLIFLGVDRIVLQQVFSTTTASKYGFFQIQTYLQNRVWENFDMIVVWFTVSLKRVLAVRI
jgi:hypothetical protein